MQLNVKTIKILSILLSIFLFFTICFNTNNNLYAAASDTEKKIGYIVLGGIIGLPLIIGIISALVSKNETKKRHIENIEEDYKKTLRKANNISDNAYNLCKKGIYKDNETNSYNSYSLNNNLSSSLNNYLYSNYGVTPDRDVNKMYKRAESIYIKLINQYKNISYDDTEIKSQLTPLYKEACLKKEKNHKRYYICLFRQKIELADEYLKKGNKIKAYTIYLYIINKYNKFSQKDDSLKSNSKIIQYYNKAKVSNKAIINYYRNEFQQKLNQADDLKKKRKILESCEVYNQILLDYNNITNVLSVHLDEQYETAKEKIQSELSNIYKTAVKNNKMKNTKKAIVKYTLFTKFFDNEFKLSPDIKENFIDMYNETQSILYSLKLKWLTINNNKYKRYKNLLNKIKNINIKLDDLTTTYAIKGKIKDINSDIEIFIWGVAIPNSTKFNSKGTRMENSNIKIFYYKRSHIYGNITFLGYKYYYVGKEYGKNMFGANVPVYIYSSNNPYKAQAKKLNKKKEKMLKEFNKLKNYLYFWDIEN